MREREKKRRSQILTAIENHIYHNLKSYGIVALLFLIGIIAGVFFVNHEEIEIKQQIGNEITTFIEALKTDYQIDSMQLLKEVIGSHILLTFLMWFMGCMVIGIPIVYGIVIIRGFSLGYTMASLIYLLGAGKGSLFCLISLLLQNLLTIPAILALAVSGSKLYQSIMKDKRRENIKIEIIRHTIFSLFMLIVLMIAAIVEVYGSNVMISICANYF